MCRSTARFVIPRLRGDRAVAAALGDQGEDLELARRQLRRAPSRLRWRAETSLSTTRESTSERPAATSCSARLSSLLSCSRSLSRYARRSEPAVEERHRVARLGVLAEHDDAHLRVLLPELGGEADALVRVRGRHPDVGQDDVRRRALDGVAQLVEVARHLDELDVFDVVEDADDPLAGEEAVLGGDDADRHRPRA